MYCATVLEKYFVPKLFNGITMKKNNNNNLTLKMSSCLAQVDKTMWPANMLTGTVQTLVMCPPAEDCE